MKFFNRKILLLIIAIALFSCAYGVKVTQGGEGIDNANVKQPFVVHPQDGYTKEYMQKDAYPSQYHAATNTTQLLVANFTSPMLSQALSELNPKGKMRSIDFLNAFNYVAYRMTRGEAAQLFKFADADRNDLLDHQEWENFVALYAYPFQACDQNKDFLLDTNEFGLCAQKDPKFKNIVFPRRYGDKPWIPVMDAINTRSNSLLNFYEYLFVRRGLYAWYTCKSSAKYIATDAFGCAITTALGIDKKFSARLTINEIYKAGLHLDNDFAIQHNFVTYLVTLTYFNYFNLFSEGSSIAILEQEQLLKAIREDKLPNNMTEEEVKFWFELISSNPFKKATNMTFTTFLFFYKFHRLFNKYAVSRPNQLRKEEFLKLVEDTYFDYPLLHSIDLAFTQFSKIEYQEGSLSLGRIRGPKESTYYNSFLATSEEEHENKSFLKEETKEAAEASFTNLAAEAISNKKFGTYTEAQVKELEEQDASENTGIVWNPKSVNATFWNPTYNLKNRETIYSMFQRSPAHYWTKNDYYRCWTLANLFVYLVPDERFVVPSTMFVEKLMNAYTLVTPQINVAQRANYHIYKKFSREISIDLLTFLSVENWSHKLAVTMQTTQSAIPETIIKIILDDFGMRNMPDTVLDLSREGFGDNGQRLFNKDTLIENLVFVQSNTSDIIRMRAYRDGQNVNHNDDPARKFPIFPRRHTASPHV